MTKKRIALCYVVGAAALLVTIATALHLFGVPRGLVEDALARIFVRERFRIRDANVDLSQGTVTLDEFRLATRADPPQAPLVAIRRVHLDVDTNPLGAFTRVNQVRVEHLHLDLDLSAGRAPDLSELLEQSGADVDAEAPPPAVLVTDSRVTLRFAPDAEPVEFTDVELQLLPDEPGSRHLVLTGSMTSPAGLQTTVSGSGDFEQREFRALLEITGFPLDPSLAARFAPQIGEMLRAAELGGTADKLTLWIEYDERRLDGSEPLVAGVNLEISELRGVAPVVRYPLFGATARVAATTRDAGSVRFTLDDLGSRGDVHARGMLTHCFTPAPSVEAEVATDDLLIGPELRDALCRVPVIERIWNAFDATAGRVDATVQLRSVGGETLRAELDLGLDDVTAQWHGLPGPEGLQRIAFPEPLTNMSGRIHLRGDEVRVEGVTFTACGTTGSIDASIGVRTGEALTVVVRGDEVELGDRLRAAVAALVPAAGEIWDDYAPAGRATAEVRVTGTTGADPAVRVALRPVGGSAMFRGFPYRLERIHGSVDIAPEGVAFDLTGHRGSANARVQGRVQDKREGDAPMRVELWVDADGVPLDDALGSAVAALGPEVVRTWSFLAPQGTADCELTLWRAAGDAVPSYDLRIDARDAAIELETLPLPIRRVTGPVFVTGSGADSKIDVGVVHGILDNSPGAEPAALTAQGTVQTHRDGPIIDIVSTVRGLELIAPLRDALDHNGAFNGKTWDVLAPSGFVDVVARQSRARGAADIAHELSIELAGVGSDAAVLPTPARRVYGEVLVKDGVARFRDLRGFVGGAEVHVYQGEARHSGDHSSLVATVSCTDFPIDTGVANLFTGPLRETYLARDASGRLEVNRLDLSFRFPDDGSDFELDLRGRFNVDDVRLRVGTEITDVVGLWRIDDGHIDRSGGRIEGTIESGGFTCFGHRINGAQAGFRADQQAVELRGMRGRLHNGIVHGVGGDEPDMRYEFAGPGKLQLAVAWRDVTLSALLRAAGSNANDYRGNLSGELHLDEMVGGNIVDAKGHGGLQISEGRLGQVPLFTAIYSHLAPRHRPQFDGASIDFEFGDQRVDLRRVALSSPLLTVTGKGSVSMDGYIDMMLDFADLFGRDADWLVLPQIARFLTTGVVRFHVFGYLREPRAQPQWLWETRADEVPLGPIPARRSPR